MVGKLNIYAYLLVAFAAYLALVLVGRRAGLWKRLGISLYGPVMMVRTTRGRASISRVASTERLWTAYGTTSVIITLLAAGTLTSLLAWAVLRTSSGQSLPDLGPVSSSHPSTLVVLLYVGIGTIAAVLVHEFMHGVLAVVGKIKLDSVGVLLLLLPIGAFVEPNERELRASSKWMRLRLYAAGPATNMILAVLCGLLLVLVLLPAAKPVEPGVVVTDVAPDSPAYISGLAAFDQVTDVGGQSVLQTTDFRNLSFKYPGELTSMGVTSGGRHLFLALPGGVAVTAVTDGPALNARIEPGMIIYSFDGRLIHNCSDLTSALSNASRDQPVNITVLRFSADQATGTTWFSPDNSIRTVNLTTKWLWYYVHQPALNKEEYKNQSFLGASFSPFGMVVDEPEHLLQPIAHPLAGAKSVDSMAWASFRFVGFPFLGSSPVVSPFSDLYAPSGALSFLPSDVYWVLVNLVYWIFWINLMLGLSNALPAMPLDGALVLRDLLRALLQRIGARLTGFDLTIGRKPISAGQADRAMVLVTVIVSAMVLYLLLWQAFGPF